MLCELPKAEKSRLPSRFLPIFLLSVFLNIALAACPAIAEAQAADVEKADGKISGTVLSQGDNRTLAQVAVSLKSHTEGIFRSVLTDFDGHFEVPGLPSGTYEILVDETGYESVRTKVQVHGPSLKLVLYLMSSISLHVRQKNYTVSVRELKIPRKAYDEYEKGLVRLAKNDFNGGLDHFAKATQAFPDYYEAYYHMGVMETKLGRRDEAMQAFQKAIDLSGGRYARADFGIGYLLYLEGKPGEAETILRRGLDVDGDSADGHAMLAMALLQLNRVDEAEKSAREALLRKPGYAQAYLLLADVSARRRNYPMQLQDLDAYLELDPTGPASERAHQARELVQRVLSAPQPQH